MKFQLEIQYVERTCLFKLGWERDKQISTILPYPDNLSQLYQAWRKAYLSFYQTALRARARKSKNDGRINLPQDRHRQLVRAEAELLAEFHRWLRREELYEIRSKIASESNRDNSDFITLYLNCSGELERLPWETWQLGAEFNKVVAIARSPTKITNATQNHSPQGGKPRILAILGDNTGLNLQGDRLSLSTLQQVADIEFVTWKESQTATEIKQQIKLALTDKKGWEVLFFAGHSNETAITGGEIAIAPNIALSVSEIASELKIAQRNGLQFALFNSCSGLSLANSLIDLGLSQVAIMREPIHNQVAQVFLLQFLKALADYQNVQQALITAREYLQQQENLIYPSAYLIPSLYCHPDAPLYRLPPWGWRQQVKKWLPSRTEAIAASALCLLSLMSPVQNYLLDKRTVVQSVYRDFTGQLPTSQAPVTLVHIDEASLSKAGIDRPVPMDRQYLAQLIDRLVAAEAKVIGIDYLLDRPQPKNDPILARSVKNAVAQEQTWFVFGAYKQIDEREIGVAPTTKIGNANWTLQGYVDGLPNYMSLLPESSNCDRACPFAYLLSTIQQVNLKSGAPQPQIDNQTNLRNSLYDYLDSQPNYQFLKQTKLSPLNTALKYFGQQWFRPILDYSLPKDLVYERLSAWELLELKDINLATQTVIIGSGGYAEAGIAPGSDNLPTPNAIVYWNTRRGLQYGETPFTGSEVLAYMTHHWVNRYLVIPIPELWVVLTALLIAKGIKLKLINKIFATKLFLIILPSAATIYGLIVLQLYISQGILLPWLLPSIAIFTYLSK